MPKRIGIIQTRGIGDIVIALPIADHYVEEGFEVIWPVDGDFVSFLRAAKPTINFLPVSKGPGYFLHEPYQILKEHGCDRTLVLYSFLSDAPVYNPILSSSLKFDEYKYAVSGVPFARKWKLQFERDMRREEDLFRSLQITGDYVCVHDTGSDLAEPVGIDPEWTRGLDVVRIDHRTDNPLDWTLTLERARKLVLLDSCFSNIVEGLRLENEKSLILRSAVEHTPVYKSGWRFVAPYKDVFQ